MAHIGYFHEELVARRRWLSDHAFAGLVTLCQVLPGPASSQLGFAIGLHRGGYAGGVAASLGFTLPSALLMAGAAYGLQYAGWAGHGGLLTGLKAVAVAVVAHAVWQLGRRICTGLEKGMLALVAAVALVLEGSLGMTLGLLLAGGGYGCWRFRDGAVGDQDHGFGRWALTPREGLTALAAFFGLLFLLPLAAAATGLFEMRLADAFYRSGAMVFGGGHVILPLLEVEVVRPGWVNPDAFVAGYGLAQAMPGPLFSFAAYLGAVLESGWSSLPRWAGGLLTLAAIYLPGILLVVGVLPFWMRWGRLSWIRGVVAGAGAVMIGLLMAAFFQPVCQQGLSSVAGLLIAGVSYPLLAMLRWPAWLVVLMAGIGGVVAG